MLRVKDVGFGFYSKEEVEQMSVVEVDNPIAFDYLKNPWPKGLYDSRMGVSPFDRLGKCPTCNCQESQCPGHLGHIKLMFPVYNLFIMKKLHRILQSYCFECNRMTLTDNQKREYYLLLKCLNLGKKYEFEKMKEIMHGRRVINKSNQRERKNSQSTQKSEDEQGDTLPQEILLDIKNQKRTLINTINQFEEKDYKITTAEDRQLKQLLIKEILTVARGQQKCPHCEETKPTIKKDGNTKFSMISKNKKNGKKQSVLGVLDAKEHLKLILENDRQLFREMFALKVDGVYKEITSDCFFIEILPVSPNRFRPESVVNNQTYLHPHTTLYTKVLTIQGELVEILKNQESEDMIHQTLTKQIQLQETINTLMDSGSGGKLAEKTQGIKQLLEKKEGIFRMKLMGKRVNQSARSVISPDPLLETYEVGMPLFMAKKLSYPEHVNSHNVEILQKAIINGAKSYPGALILQEKNRKILLEKCTDQQRKILASKLLQNAQNKIVYRHIRDGDVVLFNRQPTLHKNSLMSFQVKVLKKHFTIRMHYSNCSGFNADFDGDEMNIHVLQNYQARTEGLYLSLSDKQYIMSTNGNPIRGLIQDFVFSSVFLTSKDLFFNKDDFCQLLYQSLVKTIEMDPFYNELVIPFPAILKPQQLWTGKQLFSSIMDYLANYDQSGLDDTPKKMNMTKSTRINQSSLPSNHSEENQVVIRDNILVKGLIDKNAIGTSSYGLIHCFFELFGTKKTSQLFSAITRVCIDYIKIRGFSCGLADLILINSKEKERVIMMENLHQEAVKAVSQYLKIEPKNSKIEFFENFNKIKNEKLKIESSEFDEANQISSAYQQFAETNEKGLALIDQVVKSSIANLQSSLYQETIGNGLKDNFPHNNFSCMVLTGAKGSRLNHSQISCNLGQQELEGKRVPLMSSGKTLPCWGPFNPNPRCGGFIGDRFLTGLRSQEFYFHCMAGREGLVDTAVKTSRSGYLQRILVKNLESLKIEYDYTVRNVNDGSVVQFNYGEDCLDPMKVNMIDNMEFMLDNFDTIKNTTNLEVYEEILTQETISKETNESILSKYNPAKTLGALSEKRLENLENFIEENRKKIKKLKISEEEFKKYYYLKYFESLAQPGDGVGAIAAQCFGEPSTQMTLNTFHLAGHGGANVTLGIPRLKELMTAKSTKNPMMFLPFKKNLSQKKKQKIIASLENSSALEFIKEIKYKTQIKLIHEGKILSSEERCYVYKIKVIFEDIKKIYKNFNLNEKTFKNLIQPKFDNKLTKALQRKLKQSKGEEEILANFKMQSHLKTQKLILLLQIPIVYEQPQIINLLENVFKDIRMKSLKGVGKSKMIQIDKRDVIQVEGINFKLINQLRNNIDVNQVSTNSIHSIADKFGIEAARNAWIREIRQVFSYYGIKIDNRHGTLVADHMTFPGYINPMSRVGIKNQLSPFLKMSFETTMNFLIESCVNQEKDTLQSASASLVVGQPMKIGTGSFDLLMDFK